MPAAKNTSIRYHVINHCLSGKRKKYWSAKELIDKMLEKDIRINDRTLRYDIDAMRYDKRLGYDAPIDYCKTNKGYYYTEPEYSISSINFSEEQWKAFDFVINALHEFQDLKIMQEFRAAIDKLAGVFSQLRNPGSSAYIEFEKAPYYKGLDLRDEILNAIHSQTVLEIKYTTFARSYPLKHIVHPYSLKEYKNRWYLVGLLNSRKNPITLALDRMDKISVTSNTFLPNTYFNPQGYFSNIIGITYAEGEPEEIILHASASLANYIKTQHLHASQEIIKEDKSGIHIQLKVIPNYELTSTILSHGKDIKVIKPESLREQIRKNLEETLKRYNTDVEKD